MVVVVAAAAAVGPQSGTGCENVAAAAVAAVAADVDDHPESAAQVFGLEPQQNRYPFDYNSFPNDGSTFCPVPDLARKSGHWHTYSIDPSLDATEQVPQARDSANLERAAAAAAADDDDDPKTLQ